MASSISPVIDWDILGWLRRLTNLPVVIKGIQCVEDAVLAYEHGVQGIVLSNHGGRSQDTSVSPIIGCMYRLTLTAMTELNLHS